jgi:hypothetical protein
MKGYIGIMSICKLALSLTETNIVQLAVFPPNPENSELIN